jgi:hypothetical protein
MASIDGASLGDIFKPAHWEKIRREGINALQRQTLNQRLRRRIAEGFPFGMALEELTAADVPYQTRV